MGWGCVLEGGGWGDVNAHGKNVNLGGGEVNAEVLFLGKLYVVQEKKKRCWYCVPVKISTVFSFKKQAVHPPVYDASEP